MLFERETTKTPFGSAPRNEQPTVHIKGRPGALEILLDEEAPLTTILRDLQALLSQNQTMLHGVAVRLNFGERPIDRLQLGELKRILERFDLKLQRIDLAPTALEDFLEEAFGLPVHIKSQTQPLPNLSPLPPISSPLQEETLPPLQMDTLASSAYAAKPLPPSFHPPSPETSYQHTHPTHKDTPQYALQYAPQAQQYAPQAAQAAQAQQYAHNTASHAMPHERAQLASTSTTADYPAHIPPTTNNPTLRTSQQPMTPPSSQRAITPPSSQRAITPPSSQRAITPPSAQRAITPSFSQPFEQPHTPALAASPSRRASLSERLAAKQPAYEPQPPHGRRETIPYEEDRDLDDLPDTLMPFTSHAAEAAPEEHSHSSAPHAEIDTTSSTGRQVHRIMRTCRAGTRLDLEGDVWVFGDVNPGAEIRATGDIVIFGSLRGIAHAGSEGNEKAIIAAFELSPMQLRLGPQIAVAPPADGRSKQRVDTEVAFLNQHNQIEVKNYQGKFPHEVQKNHA